MTETQLLELLANSAVFTGVTAILPYFIDLVRLILWSISIRMGSDGSVTQSKQFGLGLSIICTVIAAILVSYEAGFFDTSALGLSAAVGVIYPVSQVMYKGLNYEQSNIRLAFIKFMDGLLFPGQKKILPIDTKEDQPRDMSDNMVG